MVNNYRPPFSITPEIVSLVADISGILGRMSGQRESAQLLRLRRANRIRTVQATLAIEGNSLGTDQVTAIVDGKRVLAPAREIQEVRNALQAYESMEAWNPLDVTDLLAAHKVLMSALVDAPGAFRTGSVGIAKGREVIHVAPPAKRVAALVNDLLAWLSTSKDHPLIASSVFHCEFELIHPFPDGNGRLGRLWQTLILFRWNPVFALVPVETMVCMHQKEYYTAINQSTAHANASVFLAFMLGMIRKACLEAYEMSEQMSEKMPEKILRLVAAKPGITIAELARACSLTTRTIERTLKILRTQGRLVRTGPAKGGTWQVLGGDA